MEKQKLNDAMIKAAEAGDADPGEAQPEQAAGAAGDGDASALLVAT